MISRGNARVFVVVSGAFLAITTIVLLISWLFRAAAEIDREPPSRGVKAQMMHRKTDAMQDILDGMIRGDLPRMEKAANRLAVYGRTVEWYLAAAEYQGHGENFRVAVDDIMAAAQARDIEAAKEATLRLERSCLECHVLIFQRSQ